MHSLLNSQASFSLSSVRVVTSTLANFILELFFATPLPASSASMVVLGLNFLDQVWCHLGSIPVDLSPGTGSAGWPTSLAFKVYVLLSRAMSVFTNIRHLFVTGLRALLGVNDPTSDL